MNQFLVALIGLLVILSVGFVFYGLIFKDLIKNVPHPAPSRIVIGMVAMYIVALAFTVLFRNITFAEGTSGMLRGLYLGLFVGVPFLALPLLADGQYLQTKSSALWLVVTNWVVALAVLGIVAGALL